MHSAAVMCHLLLCVPAVTTKGLAGMAAFFFGNMAQSSLTQTGAFEVFYNGALVSCYHTFSPCALLLVTYVTCTVITKLTCNEYGSTSSLLMSSIGCLQQLIWAQL